MASKDKAPPAKKQKLRHGRYLSDWEIDKAFKGMVKASADGSDYAHCIPCAKAVKVTASGRFDLVRHFETESHKNNVKKAKQHIPLSQHFRRAEASISISEVTTVAEVLFCKFLADHNLPTTTADHFTDLVRKMFPESKSAATFSCKRTKATQIIKKCLAEELSEPVFEQCRTGPFSLMIDESNDKNTLKRLIVLARVFDSKKGAATRVLGLPVPSGGTAQEIFAAVEAIIV